MSWTCACDTQNRDAARFCEFCGAEHQPAKPSGTGSGIAWSPPTPKYEPEPWRDQPQWQLPEDVQSELTLLRAKLGVRQDRPTLDPAQTAKYLEACQAAKATGTGA